jgi:hypothetical protein
MNNIRFSAIREKPSDPMLEHEIRLRAYDIYLQRGCADGHALDDWLQAETEILRRLVPRDFKRL